MNEVDKVRKESQSRVAMPNFYFPSLAYIIFFNLKTMAKTVPYRSTVPIILGKVHAHIFLDDVKRRLENHPGVFKSLLLVLDMFYKDREIKGFLARISRLLFPFPDVLDEIRKWLPPGSSLEYKSDNCILIKHGSFTRSILSSPRRSPRKKP